MTTPDVHTAGQSAGDLARFLAERDVHCPSCGYNLRGLAADRCPECGQTLVLSELGDPRPGALQGTPATVTGALALIGLTAVLGPLAIGLITVAAVGTGTPMERVSMVLCGVSAGGLLAGTWQMLLAPLRRPGGNVRRIGVVLVVGGVFGMFVFGSLLMS